MDINKKNVLVTGADGFIGSHLVEALLLKNCTVRALSYYNSFNNWGWLENIPRIKDIEVICGDVRDYHFMKRAPKGINIVFHLAALIGIPYSYVAPASYVDTNITGTLNLCQAALKNGCEKVVHISTSEVYGTALYVPIDEKHPLQPQSPYSASKTGADAMALSYYFSFNLPLVVARPFNTYGPRQSARAVIPTIITQINKGEKKIKLGNLSPTRDFNYVKDITRGFILLAESDKTCGEVVNIGSNFEISIQKTVDTIVEMMGSEIEIITDTQRIRPKHSEVERLWCDNTKIKILCGFKPEYNIKRGLKETINWFTELENQKFYKTDIYNI